MATMLPPVYGVAFEFDVVLFAQSDNQIKTSPTIAAGDFVISKANGATANLTTTPSESPASSGIVRVQLSATEMEADKLTVKWHDASGAEWHDGAVTIFTAGQTFDTIEGLVDELESRLTATRAAYLDNLSAGAVALQGSVDDLEGRLTAARAGYLDKLNVSGTLAHSDAAATYKADVTALALEATAQAILDDTAEIGAAGAGLTAADDAVIAAIGTLNNLSSAQAQSAAAAALNAYDPPTKAELDSAVAPLATAVAVADVPTNAELAAALAAADDAVLAAVAALSILDAAGIRTAIGLAAANLDAQLAAVTAPSAADVADAVWDEALAGHATAGSAGAQLSAAGAAGDPWSTALPGAYAEGTAGNIVGSWDDTVFVAVATAAAVNGSNLSIHRGDTFTASITGLGDIQARTALYWTVKEHVNKTDAKAAVQVEEDNGLLVLKGAAATSAIDGDIAVTNAVTGAITLTLAAAATAELTPGTYYYDVQVVTASGVETLTAASLTVVADVTRAVS